MMIDRPYGHPVARQHDPSMLLRGLMSAAPLATMLWLAIFAAANALY